MANLFYVVEPGQPWVLIDTGIPFQASRIRRVADGLFGEGAKPACILLTHGHFDHIGNVKDLADEWDVPVYAHTLELPYLTGRSAYPPPDPTVGGGLLARMSSLYPKQPIDLGDRVQLLPRDGSVPGLPGWRWVHTPGHTTGHVSFFRDSDKTLIAGDAFVTTKQESVSAVYTQRKEIHGPPMYFTSDWQSARDSVRRLNDLQPSRAGTGHGMPMVGGELHRELERLATHFDQLAMPEHGRYVPQPARADERGVISVPPPVADPMPAIFGGLILAALAGYWIANRQTRT